MAVAIERRARSGRRRRLRRGLLAATLSTIATLLVLEVFARLFVTPALFSFRPAYAATKVAGYHLKANTTTWLYGADVAANSCGNRGPEWTRAKPAGVFRIALIGDSLAFGFGVPFASSCGEVLARELSQRTGRTCEVLNFALPGYNSRQELEVLEHEALAFAPDAVLVVACSNDHEDGLWVDAEGWQHWGRRADVDTRIHGAANAPNSNRWGILSGSALLTWAKMAWTRHQAAVHQPPQSDLEAVWMPPVTPGPVPDDIRTEVLEPLLQMHELCRARGVPMVLAMFAASQGYRRCCVEYGRATGAPVLEIPTLFPKIKTWEQMVAEYGLGWDSHPNERAHAIWGRGFADLFVARGIAR